MSVVIYDELTIDGVRGLIYDREAVHNDGFSEALTTALSASSVKTAFLNMFFPVGTYHITADSTNPSMYLGGSWVQVEGRVLLGASAAYPEGSTGGSADAPVVSHSHNASGAASEAGSHTHPMHVGIDAAGGHVHTIASSLPKKTNMSDGNWSAEDVGEISGSSYKMAQIKQSQSFTYSNAVNSSCGQAGSHTHGISVSTIADGAHTHDLSIDVTSAGESGVGKNMMPYIAAYIWKRVA